MSAMKDRDFANAELDKAVKEKFEVEESIKKLAELKEQVSQNRYEEVLNEFKKTFEELENSTIEEMYAKENFLNSIGQKNELKMKDKYIKARDKKEDDQIKFEKISKIKEELDKKLSEKRVEKKEEKKGILSYTIAKKEPLKVITETNTQTKQLKEETPKISEKGGLTEEEMKAEAPEKEHKIDKKVLKKRGEPKKRKIENKNSENIYIVKKGDNLTNIAKENNLGILQILRENPGITSTDILKIGQKIKFPKIEKK